LRSSEKPTTPTPTPESLAHAEEAGLRFVSDANSGITRSKPKNLFRYTRAGGDIVRDTPTLDRIRQLAIPPAWTEVWICPTANGHIQATGRDARNRKQYIYHADWIKTRDDAKFHRILAFAHLLPRIRKTVKRHMSKRGLGRDKVLATVVHLLQTTLIRVGNQEYARDNQSFGLSTLQDKHVTFSGSQIRFKFRGKTGKEWRLKISDRRVARIVKACHDLPGQQLFQYEDEAGESRHITSSDVNGYLREIAGSDVTAKDFRTWAGTVLAAMALSEFDDVDSEAAAKRNIKNAIVSVATRLGNTPTICRKCYVHPEVLDCYVEGALLKTLREKVKRELKGSLLTSLSPEEAATLALLHNRLSRRKPRRRRNGKAKG
jgi:DNA topoisomerase-1